ncbi:molybdopterin-dependent oxidoreductase [Halomonas elongata]|uniref:molybdopterin-dependent oxidoreductase n=1 Tax=Halomonas elongata TaxID=2746 RepID=UPI0040332D3A
MTTEDIRYHSSHWGTFAARHRNGTLEITPFAKDPDPSPVLDNIPAALNHPARLSKPLIRRGWLENGPGPDRRRGEDDFVEVEWDEALDLAAQELRRLGAGPDQCQGGPVAGAQVFGGSYGWASAGRFHHVQSQIHRFLNSVFGGYVGSVDSYSSAAGGVILDLVWGNPLNHPPSWREIAEDTELLIAFGGLALRNHSSSPGGTSQHVARSALEAASARGCQFVSVSPLRDDFADLPEVTRLAPRPATDVALMLGMAWHLHDSGRVDHDYLARYTRGYEHFEAYLTGRADGIAKTPEWAAEICDLPAGQIIDLAERAASKRTHITVAYSLQRSRYGEEPIWMALTLAAMLGQYPSPGAGFSYGLASIGNLGKPPLDVPLPVLPQGRNRVDDVIPVARIAELLLNPGEPYTYKGETRHYADIRLVYWAGGNPFHHHQDLEKLREGFTRPDTVIIHESVSTASTRYADIIFPATLSAEREDIGASSQDPFMVPMQQLAPPRHEARDDYAIFTELAARLECQESFTEGRTSREWLRHMYEPTRRALSQRGLPAPDFDEFMQGEPLELPVAPAQGRMTRFHEDPDANPLDTPSGKLEIWSDIVASSDLPGHPAWIEPEEWLGGKLARTHRFQLVANQPKGRLHSQLDFGATSMSLKQDGRECARLNPQDAARMGIQDGDVIRLWNQRGATLAAARISDDLPPSIVQLSTGAWYAPRDLQGSGMTCVNGNPNILTSDIGASGLSQGCAGQLTLVSIARWDAPLPDAVPHEAMLEIARRRPREAPPGVTPSGDA